MPSAPPSGSNGYTFNLDHYIDPATLNPVFGDIHARLEAREALEASFEALIVQGTADAITAIQVGIAPQVQTIVDQLGELQDQIALAEDQLAALLSGGVVAANVVVAAGTFGPAPVTAQQAFGLIAGELTSLGTTLGDVQTTADGAQQKAEKNQANGYAGLGADGKVPVALLSSRVVSQTFTASGTFTKEADDIAYRIIIIGGGNGGYYGQTSTSGFTNGGNGGCAIELFLDASQVGATESVIVGAGGTGGTSSNTPGTVGGVSSFGAYSTAAILGNASNNIGADNIFKYAATGMALGYLSDAGAPPIGNKYAAPGGSHQYTQPRPGGLPLGKSTGAAPAGANATVPGGGGGAGPTGGNGGNGMAPGGGGGAGGYHASTPGLGGNGARGEVRVYRFKK